MESFIKSLHKFYHNKTPIHISARIHPPEEQDHEDDEISCQSSESEENNDTPSSSSTYHMHIPLHDFSHLNLSQIPSENVTISTQQSLNTSPCPICREKYIPGQKINKLMCGHVFHQDCLYPWFTSTQLKTQEWKCPQCQQYILQQQII